MPELSHRAKRFLENQQRYPSTVNRKEIIESFLDNEAPIFEPLIKFQEKYSGYKFLAGVVPIHFGLLQGDGGYPARTGTAIVEFRSSETRGANYQFVCATSEFPMDFTLDENGCYYEDNTIVASCFEKTIEHLAIWNELSEKSEFKTVLQNQKVDIHDLDKRLGLTIIPEASDAYTLWFTNDITYLTQCGGRTTIISSGNFENINAILKQQ